MQIKNHQNYNCRATLDDGSEYLIYANWLHNQELDHWQGWRCTAGSDRIYVDKNLEIWGGECKNDRLGDFDQGWQLMGSITTCQRSRCTGCTDDLQAAKWEV